MRLQLSGRLPRIMAHFRGNCSFKNVRFADGNIKIFLVRNFAELSEIKREINYLRMQKSAKNSMIGDFDWDSGPFSGWHFSLFPMWPFLLLLRLDFYINCGEICNGIVSEIQGWDDVRIWIGRDGALAPSAPRSAAQRKRLPCRGTIWSVRYYADGDAVARRPYRIRTLPG